MSEETDALGKALSLNLKGLSRKELLAAVTGIQKAVGSDFVANIFSHGFLAMRAKITSEEWEASRKSIQKAIKSSRNMEPSENVEPFDPDYLPPK